MVICVFVGIAVIAWTVISHIRAFQANVALGTQEWLKREASGHIEVRDPVCQALALKISTM